MDFPTELQISDELLVFVALVMWIVKQVLTWKTTDDTKRR